MPPTLSRISPLFRRLVGLVLAVPTACVARVLLLELFWEKLLAAQDASTASRKDSPCPPSRA